MRMGLSACAMAALAVGGCGSTDSPPDLAGPGESGTKAAVEMTMLDGDQIRGPFVHANLAVYLIVNPSVNDAREFMTLDEGLHSGLVTINESGGSQGNDNASVAQLEVTNKSTKWLYIEAGEVVRGGKQDRTMGRDLVVKPGVTNQPLAAFCVEQGRWTATMSGSISSFNTNSNTQARMRAIAGNAGSSFSAPDVAQLTLNASAAKQGLAFTGAAASLSSQAKIALLKNKSQGDVWKQVAADRNSNGAVQSPSGTFVDVLNDPKVMARVQPYVTELLQPTKGRTDVVGAIFAVDGVVVATDIYGAPGLFMRLYPKLLESHARDAALTADGTKPVPPSPSLAVVSAFVKLAQTGEVSDEPTTTGQNMLTCENDETIAFESRENGKRMHYSALRKKK